MKFLEKNNLRTLGLIGLIIIGLSGVGMRYLAWPAADLLVFFGFFGFPVLYGYITWPVNRRYPDQKWWSMVLVMLLFGLIIFFKD